MIDDAIYEERKTSAGFLVKVRLSKMTYVVFSSEGPEVPKGARNNSIVVNVPKVGFFGEEFRVGHFHLGELSFVNVKMGKMVIPYHHGFSNEIKTIFLATGSASDALPVVIFHYRHKEELMHAWESGEQVHYLVVDEEIPRNEMVTLKIRYPNLNILVIKKKISLTETAKPAPSSSGKTADGKAVVDYNKVRAADVARTQSSNEMTGNPVFLARIHLRNMELDKVKQLLLENELTLQDVGFIRTFLEVMIKNENNKPELKTAKDKLISMSEVFRLSLVLLEFRIQDFEAEMEKGFSPEVSNMMYALLAKEQDKTSDIEKEIVFWEWKLRARRMTQAK